MSGNQGSVRCSRSHQLKNVAEADKLHAAVVCMVSSIFALGILEMMRGTRAFVMFNR